MVRPARRRPCAASASTSAPKAARFSPSTFRRTATKSRPSPGRIAIRSEANRFARPRRVDEQVVVYGSQGKAIYGLDPANGEEKWKLPTRSRVESSPVIAGNRVVAATAAGKIYLLDAATGEVKWEYDAGGSFTASPAVVDGRIILGNTDGTLYCFGAKNRIKEINHREHREHREEVEMSACVS